jgi:hypothetical protein
MALGADRRALLALENALVCAAINSGADSNGFFMPWYRYFGFID